MSIRQDIIDEARSYIGTRFQHQARLKGIAVDCVGLVVGVARELGLSDADYTRYPRHPTGELVRRMEETGYERIELEDAQPGDVICYGLRRTSKFANHLAVRTDYGIIHTDAHAGAVVEVHFVDEWVERARHAYVFPGVDEPWRP